MNLPPTQLKIETQRYLNAGFSVIPVNNKQPLVEWREYQTRQPNLDELRNWFSQDLKAIGIVTGKISDIVVLDIEQGAKTDGLELPPTLIAKTGGGGWHYYYRYPKGVEIKNSVKKLGDKIDVRSDGGFVVAPPSLHTSGKNYEWVEEPRFDCIADLPKWVIEKAGEAGEKKNWKEFIKGVPQGSRNDTATALVGKLLFYLPESEWEVIGYEYLKNWNQANKPPLAEKELEQTFLSIAERELARRLIKNHEGQL